jgi:hypothetical protein
VAGEKTVGTPAPVNQRVEQAQDIMVSMKMKVNKPPRALKTRWDYIIPILQWVGVSKPTLLMYNSLAPGDYANNDDGTTFKDHRRTSDGKMRIAYQLEGSVVNVCM